MENYIKPFADDTEIDAESVKNEYITIVLRKGDGKKRQLRCMHCGGRIMDYYSSMKMIIEGKVVSVGKEPFDIMCTHRCRTIYRII